ncbi:hypothetical protein Q1695_002729 [Nippostrongylus brasiliensis]|nr:hypothetical protein Q1695_002729 [Nippostrongylus brasiliensis]
MTTLSKAEYLQRYLSSGKEEQSGKKKKKKTNEAARASGLRIVEDDAFIAVSAKYKDIDTDEEKEDIEIISSITKQVEARAREAPKFRNSFQPIDEVKQEPPSPEQERGRRRHDSDADDSPPRESRRRYDSDSDVSPPRKSRHRHDSDADNSPPRRSRHRHDSDADIPPPRKKRRRHDSDSDISPPRRRDGEQRKRCEPEHSSIGKSRRNDPPLRSTASSKAVKVEVDSDQSPPRNNRFRGKSRGSDSDQSPPWKRGSDRVQARKRGSDSDQSPPRRRGSDSDQSPPRKRDRSSHKRPEEEKSQRRRITTPERIGKESQRTLEGKMAGLQSAEALKKESEQIREREKKMFEEMDASISGRYADTTVRQKQIKRGREKTEDKEKKEREAKKQAELEEKYKLWSKGVSQAQEREKLLEDMAKVVAEPVARMADDEEMNRHLKEQIYEEDPMAAMLHKKKRDEALDRGDLIYPTYQGAYPPNRFGIRPGYRWDGVDRSNGFEARLAQAKNKRDAQNREFYQNIQCYE